MLVWYFTTFGAYELKLSEAGVQAQAWLGLAKESKTRLHRLESIKLFLLIQLLQYLKDFKENSRQQRSFKFSKDFIKVPKDLLTHSKDFKLC